MKRILLEFFCFNNKYCCVPICGLSFGTAVGQRCRSQKLTVLSEADRFCWQCNLANLTYFDSLNHEIFFPITFYLYKIIKFTVFSFALLIFNIGK